MHNLPVPRLAPPGAGLPTPELYAARLIFGFERWSSSREKASAKFSAQKKTILHLITSVPTKKAIEPVLIPRLRGLEDSSRYWSLYMTLDHLRIVNTAIADTIRQLGQGIIPLEPASTAAVKPHPDSDPKSVPAFCQSCDDLERSVDGVSDLKTSARYAHPWFGPLDAYGWHVMSAFHMNLHRQQIETILQRMPAAAT